MDALQGLVETVAGGEAPGAILLVEAPSIDLSWTGASGLCREIAGVVLLSQFLDLLPERCVEVLGSEADEDGHNARFVAGRIVPD